MSMTLAIGAIIGAIIAFFGNRLLEDYRKKNNEKILMNSLFGELLHVFQHFNYSTDKIKEKGLTPDEIKYIKKVLLFTKYGKFISGKHFDRYGFLSEVEIKNLLQLSLRIRNSDYLIDLILDKSNTLTPEQYNEIAERANFICKSTQHLLSYIISKNPSFESSVDFKKFQKTHT